MGDLKQILMGLLLALLVLAGGCAPPSTPSEDDSPGTVSLWVTRDFGEEVLFASDLSIGAGQSVLGLLHEHLEVETEYGGGFVNAIEGLESGYSGTGGEGQRVDWFYYVNGILSSQGAADYMPQPGDIIWWDYRPWGDIAFTPAVVGAFPQPFIGGYKGKNPGTLVLAGQDCREPAERLAEYLQKEGAEVQVAPYQEEEAVHRSRMVLVVAKWEELDQSPFWKGVQQHRDRTGWFAALTPQGFYPLDPNARPLSDAYWENAGAVLATGAGLGDPHPLWLVTAPDEIGLVGVIEALTERPREFEKKVGALVVEGQVLGLPGSLP